MVTKLWHRDPPAQACSGTQWLSVAAKATQSTLSLGRMSGLAKTAAAEGGAVVQATGTAREVWKASYGAMRSADRILFHTTGVPTFARAGGASWWAVLAGGKISD
jgi:hypothetical protein